MKVRPVLVTPWTARVAAGLADTIPGRTTGDVLQMALAHEIEMLAEIQHAGLGDRPIKGRDLLGLYVQACNLLAARAAREGIQA